MLLEEFNRNNSETKRGEKLAEFNFGVRVELCVEFLRIEFMRYFEEGNLSTKPEET